ncbi:amidohydrolase family protein [Myxococcus sp. CA033]|uniref:N-acyl-D-amino-acid deacylase family protein n=1 Tax=Myxococcus sp. CA033 TaxID=2741516 RepID=UPI00157AF2F4|nr:amidohydrolase family protein [Myxococcus sp. CA033]NTX40431.1 amidohydrolase family protein [Myxococcus sp. CA033]
MDLIVENGLVFDGLGNPPRKLNVGIRGDTVAALTEGPIERAPHTRVIDAAGHWVTPGFIDLHTHYDAEVELAPSLSESVRHGVTTVVVGSCSLSLAVGKPEDLADMFCRVEAIPYDTVRSLLEQRKTWDSLGGYLEHLETLPLGPNVASMLGHSALRAHAMGLHRSLEPGLRPSEDELRRMEAMVTEGLDLGYLGMSIMTLKWDKMGGSRDIRSRPLPSTYARWSEYRRLTKLLRARGRVFQGVPNISTKVNVVLFLLESMGLWRKTLKTTVISMMDPRASRGIHRLIGVLSRAANTLFGANFRWQALPEVFDLWADGIDLVVFEEFGAGAAALHLQDAASRAGLLKDPEYRARFRSQWTNRFLPRAFHRDFNQSRILECPDKSLVNKSFAQVAQEQGRDAVDVFLDLVATHGDALRWYTVMANDRLKELEFICQHPDILVGFSDAGAHLRNMAHYNFPLRLLRLVREAQKRGEPFMTVERAVHRLTGEIGDWFGMDAGVLAEGRRADLVVINPDGLDEKLDEIAEAPMENFGGFVRLVRRNDAAVKAVLIAGREAVSAGTVSQALGQERGFGRVLRAGA